MAVPTAKDVALTARMREPPELFEVRRGDKVLDALQHVTGCRVGYVRRSSQRAVLMSRRKSTFLDELTLAPWPVGVIAGALVLAGGLWGPAWLATLSNPFIAGFGRQLATGVMNPLVYAFAALCGAAAAVSAWRRAQRRKLLDTRSDLESLRAMNWRELEQLVAEAYQRLGYQVEENVQAGADGGVDLRLRRSGELTLVQCKHWRTQRVGASVVREQFGLLAHHRAAAVLIVTTGDFTAEARAFAQGKPIELVVGAELLSLVKGVQRRTEPGEPTPASLSGAAAPPAAASCPLCAAPMVQRTARQTGARFLGCSKFPACRGTRPAM